VQGHCKTKGFFIIINHGVSADVITNVWAASKAFFDLPLADKRAVLMAPDYPYGYSGFGEEVLSLSKDKTETAADLKETFQICLGPDTGNSDHPMNSKPLWPPRPPELQPAWTAYYRALEKLSSNLLRMFALALKLPEDWFEDKIDRHVSALRALNYPHQDQPPLPGQLRASAHTDYGSLTILKQDNAPGGLQVRGHDGLWHDVKTGHLQDAFVINLGDLMARWTNDQWVSTLHRVINPPREVEGSTRRQSMAFFHNLNPDAEVKCIETCSDDKNPPKYPPIRAGEHLFSKHKSANKY